MIGESPEYINNWDAFQKDTKTGNLKKYEGEYVGYHNGNLVSHSSQIDEVIKDLEKLESDPKKIFIEKADFVYEDSPFWYDIAQHPKKDKDTFLKELDLKIKNDKLTLTMNLDQPTTTKKHISDIDNSITDPIFPIKASLEELYPEVIKDELNFTAFHDHKNNKVTFTVEKPILTSWVLQGFDNELKDKINSNSQLSIKDKNDILFRIGGH